MEYMNQKQIQLKKMNAKKELLAVLENIKDNLNFEPKVKCALILKLDTDSDNLEERPIVLKQNHTEQDYQEFLSKLDFDYDAGYGLQEIFGSVLLDNQTWLERGEYDGSEWWNIHRYPEIPKECL